MATKVTAIEYCFKAYGYLSKQIEDRSSKDLKATDWIKSAVFGYLYYDIWVKTNWVERNTLMGVGLTTNGLNDINACSWLGRVKDQNIDICREEENFISEDELRRKLKEYCNICKDKGAAGVVLACIFHKSLRNKEGPNKTLISRICEGIPRTNLPDWIMRGLGLRDWLVDRGFKDERQDWETIKDWKLKDEEPHKSEILNRGESSDKIPRSHNRIIFGAPGTGKSHQLKIDQQTYFKDKLITIDEKEEDAYERVTFHPDYYYSNFVGAYKPVMKTDESGKEEIAYEFIPGPFLRVYAKAKKTTKNVLLIIEEINRANVAAVFGDVFQLLDRDENGNSEYKVAASEDVKKWLESQEVNETELSIPSNMYIWATMNSADQGVFPMDTAFKRRWSFEYLSLNPEESDVNTQWNDFRKTLNNVLINELGVNEDKCMGPYFLKKEESKKWGKSGFADIFANKVLMYLFEDAVKHKRSTLFINECKTYSELCRRYKNSDDIFSYNKLNEQLKGSISTVDENNGN